MTNDIERRIIRLEHRVKPPDPERVIAWWNWFTETVLAVIAGGTLPAHLRHPDQRDIAVNAMLRERGLDPDAISGWDVCLFLLDEAEAVARKVRPRPERYVDGRFVEVGN